MRLTTDASQKPTCTKSDECVLLQGVFQVQRQIQWFTLHHVLVQDAEPYTAPDIFMDV